MLRSASDTWRDRQDQAAAGGALIDGAVHPSVAGWPPAVNALGMIGQDEIARELDNQARKAKGWGERFLDKLFVGPAGVGKTTWRGVSLRSCSTETNSL